MLKRLAIGAAVVLSSLTLHATEIETFIVNGTDTSTSDYPSYARLYYNEVGNYGYCGGTFIDATHVLTAAHCVDMDDEDISEVALLFTVVIPNLDDEDDVSNAELHYVSKFYVHENYDSTDFYNDIAILELETQASVSAYAEVVEDEDTYRDSGSSQTFIAVGHGNTETGVDDTTILQEAELIYVANDDCTYYDDAAAPDSQLCMSGEVIDDLKKAVCNGDSGGPLYWTDSSNNIQVGITSYGPVAGCGNEDVLPTSVFTEVSDYSSWIENVQNGLVDATYTTSESDREYYRENGELPNSVSDLLGSGSGGGSIPLWSSLLMLGVAVLRKKK